MSSRLKEREPILHEWLAKWERKRKYREANATSNKSKKISDIDDNTTILSNLPPLSQLPPSMLPPPTEGYPKLPKVEWG